MKTASPFYLFAIMLMVICGLSQTIVAYQTGLGPARQQAAPQPSAQLLLTADALHPIIQSGAAVSVKVVNKNISTQALSLWRENAIDQIGWVYEVDVRDESGAIPPDTKFGRIFRYNEQGSPNVGPGTFLISSGGFLLLQPGETRTDVIDVGRLFDLSQPGRYTIQLERSDPNGDLVKSNLLTITVTPSQNASSTATASAGQPPFSLTIAPTAHSVQQGVPVGLWITTTNIADHNIVLWAEKAREEQAGAAYQVVVLNHEGLSQPETDFSRRMKSRTDIPREAKNELQWQNSGERLVLKPGESWKDTITANDLYSLKEPGEYTIYVQRFDPATKTMVKSNTITVTITSF